jgi:P27 family predicted phage terminase small subunit
MPRERKTIPEHELANTKPQYVLPDSDVSAGRPKYPKNLSPDAKRFFKGLCRMLERRRTLTEGDAELIRLAAILRDRHERAIEHVRTEGEICTYGDEVKENLWLKQAKDAEKQLVSLLDRLGLTPAARGKIKQTLTPEKPDPDAHLLSREAPQPPVEEEIVLPDETKVQVQ